MKKLAIFILVFFLATNIFAVDYCDGFIKNITTPALCKLLSQAEQAAKNKNFKKVSELVDKALVMKSAPEFSAKADANGPLDLKLKMAKVFCKFEDAKSNKFKNSKELEKTILSLLKEYQEPAKGKKWTSYTWLLQSLAKYYTATKNYPKLEKQVDKILEYSWDKPTVITFLSVGLENGISTSIAERRISGYIKSGGRHNAWINYLRICYKRCDGGDVFQDSLDFLKVYPKSDPNNIINTIGFLKESLNTDDKEKVKQYLDALNKLAFAQPNTEDRLVLVSKILDEKRSSF